MVSWNNDKQKTVSISTIKAKSIALRQAAREVVWIKRFINEMGLEVIENLTLYRDNELSIASIKNAESQHQTKHIIIQHHYIRELINKKKLIINWISGWKMLEDEMTKALLSITFKNHQALLRMAIEWVEMPSNKRPSSEEKCHQIRSHCLRRAREYCHLGKKATKPNKKLAPSIRPNKNLVANYLNGKKTIRVSLTSFRSF